MFEVTGIWKGGSATVVWDNGEVYGPEDFVSTVDYMRTHVVQGPEPLVFDWPDMDDATQASQVIEFLFDEVSTNTGPAIDWTGCLEEATPATFFTKHPGPGGSEIHGTGTDQSIHDGGLGASMAEIDAKKAELKTSPRSAPEIRSWALERIDALRSSRHESLSGSTLQRLNNLYYSADNLIEEALIELEDQGAFARIGLIGKHFGPGPHPGTGTPQTIHAPGGGLNVEVADESFRSQLGPLIERFGEPEGGFTFEAGVKDSTYGWITSIYDQFKADENLEAEYQSQLDKVFSHARSIKTELERDTLIRLALNEITPEEATNLGVSEYSEEYRKLGELPPVIYHVTTDTEGVIETGLMARDELAQGKGVGLGGGTSNTISFTEDEEIAKGILRSMKERHAVLNDPATHIPRLIEEAKAGTSADRPWWGTPDQTSTMAIKWEGEKADNLSGGGIQRLIDGTHIYRSSRGISTVEDLKADWLSSKGTWWKDSYEIDSIKLIDGENYNPIFEVRYTPQGHATAIGDFMDEYSMYREGAGGTLDPLFISNDDYKFKNSSPESFSIIKGTTKPGTKGYQLSSLGEWRTWTGEVIDQYEIIYDA